MIAGDPPRIISNGPHDDRFVRGTQSRIRHED
jgi:hypothetical protein